MKKLKTSIIEKIDKKQPQVGNFNQIKRKLTYTWVQPKYSRFKPWHKITLGLSSVFVIMFLIGTYFHNDFYTKPEVVDSVNEMKLVSWEDDVYLLGETIYVDYPMLTTKCNIEDKIHFSDSYWEVYLNGEQIDKENIPLSFGINNFTIYEKSINEDKKLYNLNILVGRDIENFDINLVDNFKLVETFSLDEQVILLDSFSKFESIVLSNDFSSDLLKNYDENFFEQSSLLFVVSKNVLNELLYQPIDNALNVTLIGNTAAVNYGYFIPINSISNITQYNVELFDFDIN